MICESLHALKLNFSLPRGEDLYIPEQTKKLSELSSLVTSEGVCIEKICKEKMEFNFKDQILPEYQATGNWSLLVHVITGILHNRLSLANQSKVRVFVEQTDCSTIRFEFLDHGYCDPKEVHLGSPSFKDLAIKHNYD